MANNQTFTLNIKALFDASAVKDKVADIQNAFNKLKLPDTLKKGLSDSFANLNKALSDFESRAQKGVKTSADAKGLTTSLDKVIKEFTVLENVVQKVQNEIGNTTDLSSIIQIDEKTFNQLREIDKAIKELKANIADINAGKLDAIAAAFERIKKGSKAESGAKGAIELFKQGDIDAAIAALNKVIAKQEQAQRMAQTEAAQNTFKGNIEGLTQIREQMIQAKNDAAGLQQQLGERTADAARLTQQAFSGVVEEINEADKNIHSFNEGARGAAQPLADAAANSVRLNTELSQVKSRIQYFLGLSNAVNLFKRAVQSAFNTVKELDQAMTETAVVTNFTVSDMWKQLPEYTKRANELGVTTLAAYQSATLYYQQGLNTQQAAELSTETLKMARIAGLEAADATDRMTNALRGFNMELDKTNAQRVDDVYSQLAAMSASNVDEISTAMTKVASLANNANMEFETTAAFLAQIIETTRESAETAGTALKTVVARFSEVKKLVDEGTLRGQDEEGQIIDVNKVGAALRTAGIDLNKYFLGEVGLDDIFIELASKWDSLTSVQQRYIATQAAGSRQQSRFIALMQDYARTQELVGAAYNAEGASARQFEKTQDSLQSKLARLKNAWNEFLMGITNSAVIKAAVDTLTLLLNVVNKLTGAFGNGVGGVLKFATAFAGIAGLRKAFQNGGFAEKALASLGNGPIGKFFGLGGNQTESAVTAGNALVRGGQQAAAALVAGAKEAAAIEVAGETEGAAAEVAGETGGATQNVLKGGLFAGTSQWIKNFKQQSLDPRQVAQYQQYQNLSPAEKIRAASTTGVPTIGAAPKTLFGALGNRFVGTGVGKATASILGKLGFGGAAGAAGVSGPVALAAALGTVTVAAVAAGLAIKAAYDASPAGQLKIAEKYADAMSNVASEAQKAASKVRDVSNKTKEYESAIKNATTASEHQAAIQDQNEYILSLLEQDSTYAQYVQSSFTEGGQLYLTLDSDALAAAVDKIAEGATRASAYSNFANAIVQQQTADLYRSRLAGVDLEAGTRTVAQSQGGVDIRLTEAELTRYRRYQSQIDAANIALQNYATTAASQLISLEDSNLDNELAGLVSEAFGTAFDAETIQADAATRKRQNWWAGQATDQELRAEYSRLYGVDLEKGEYDKKEVANAIALGQILEEQLEVKIPSLLETVQKEGSRTLLEAYLGKGELTSKNLLFGAEIDEEALYSLLGFDDFDGLAKDLVELADAIGITDDELREQIKLRAKEQKQAQERRALKTSAAMFQIPGIEDNKRLITDYLTMQDVEGQKLFENILSSFGAENVSVEFVDSLLGYINSADWQGSELQSWLNSIDLTNPIESFASLQSVAQNAESEFQDIAKAMLEAGEASGQFSASAQLAFLTTSDGYDELSESLAKFREENGQITSANIKELADSNKELKSLLDSGTMSAKALATALDAIENNTLQIYDFNDAIIAALNSMDDLDGIVQSTIKDLNGFDPGYDENDITGFITKAFENASENIEKGAWGNNVMGNYMRKIFGDFEYEGPQEGYGEAYKAWLQGNMAWLEANKDNMFSAWDDFVGENNSRILESGEKTAEFLEQNGEIIINANDMTTEQLINAMVATGKVTKTQAEMMIADFKNYSADFAHEMAINDLPGAIKAWYDALPDIDGQKIYDTSDLETLKTLFGVTDAEIEKAIKGLGESAEQLRGIDWTGGKTGSEGISNVLANAREIAAETGLVFDELVGKINTKTREVETVAVPNFDEMREAFSQMGISQYFDAAFEEAAQSAGEFTRTIFGEPATVAIKEGETAGEAYARAYQEAVNKNLVTQLKEAFGEGFDVKLNADKDGLQILTETDEALQKVSESADKVNGQQTTVNVDKSQADSAESSVNALDKAISKARDNAAKPINIQVNYNSSGNPDIPDINALGAGDAKGGIVVESFAGGSADHFLQPGFALTGEEGPEIVWNKELGYAYVTGKNGAEFQNLRPGDRIFSAAETQRIFRNSSFARGGEFPSYAKGYSGGTTTGKGGSGGSGSGSDKEKTSEQWKNELDWLYNLLEDIEELERDEKALNEKYEDLLKDQTKTGRDLYNLLIKQLGNLYTQLDHQTFALQKREQEMREFMDITNDQDKYLWYNWQDRTIEIDWDAIDKIQDEELYKHVKELIDEAEEIQSKMDDADDAIMDITNKIQELENIWRETFTDFEKRVFDAIVKQLQTVIDNYSELNDTINNSNSQILDSLQKEISLQRQIRDNTKTEEEITNDEARLAYLRRDTSGGNELAALQLERELAEQRQSYEDTLVDQAISRLQDDNDAAAQQREQQIEIMQAQLDYQSQSGEFNARVQELLEGAISPDGSLLTDSELMNLLKETENWGAMSEVSQQVWEEELNNTFKEVVAFLLKQNAEENGTFYTAITEAVKGVTAVIGSYSQAMTKMGDQISSAARDAANKVSSSGGAGGGPGGQSQYVGTPSPDQKNKISKYEEDVKDKISKTLNTVTTDVTNAVDNLVKKTTSSFSHSSGKFASGGLTTKTGFGWLDGTTAEPEYVLNARQTEAFLKLAEVLPAAMSTNMNTVGNTYNGTSTFNIDVHVGSIADDYDVDQLVARVKENFAEAAGYRNINALSFIR